LFRETTGDDVHKEKTQRTIDDRVNFVGFMIARFNLDFSSTIPGLKLQTNPNIA